MSQLKRATVTPSDAALPAKACTRRLWAAVVLAAAGIAVYANSFKAPLVFDSGLFIRQNALGQSPSLRDIWPEDYAIGWNRPVGFLTFTFNYLCRNEVWGYHAVNLAIHVTAAWLLFDIVRRTLERSRLAARYAPHAWGLGLAVALVWLVHPLQTSSVTYIYQRLESLMAMFYLATLWCFLKVLESPKSIGWYAASVACCALGMGTK